MGVELWLAAWTLVMQLTVSQCQGTQCQTVSTTTAQVRHFATQEACVQMQQRYQTHTPGVQETQAQGVGKLRQVTQWVCRPAIE